MVQIRKGTRGKGLRVNQTIKTSINHHQIADIQSSSLRLSTLF
jgi:hypothetical protein